jgi:transposase
MQMDIQAKLFEVALNVEEPIYIDKIEFNKGDGELHIHMDFKRGGKFDCAVCEASGCPVHDTTAKTWRHLNFFQYKCYIHLRTPNTKCDSCGVHLWIPPWGRTRSGFTMLFEAFVLTLAKEMPISKIAELVDEHDTLLWRIFNAHVKKAYSEKDMLKVTKIGIDETSSKKGHNYISVFVDMEARDVVFATVGKDAKTISKFCEELPKHGGNADNISEVSMDMSPAFISGATEKFTNASITFDKFHVVKQLNEALDEIRRNEQKVNPCLKGSRYIWLKNPSNLTVRQQNDLKTLSKENRKLSKAYQMKLTFQDIYRCIYDRDTADFALRKWLSWAVRSRLDPIKKFAKMVKSHYSGILRFFDSRLTAGLSEGINSKIQEIKRRAKGFRNMNNFISMIYLDCSNLNLPVFP